MSGPLLYGVGAFAVVVGVVLVVFGVPISEFSFGNTLIGAGTTAAVGGLIIIALGAAVARLERIAAALVTRAPILPSLPVEAQEAPAGSRPAQTPGRRSPFPPTPRPDGDTRGPYSREPRMAGPVDRPAQEHLAQEYPVEERATRYVAEDYPAQEDPAQSFSPTLRNPEQPPANVEDEVSLSPRQPVAPPPFAINGSGMAGKRQENRPDRQRQDPRLDAIPDADWQPPPPAAPAAQAQPPQTAYFDSMWPDQPKSQPMPAKSPAGGESKPEPRRDQSLRDALAAPANRPAGEQRAGAAILKSGVVDGMGYTLYVDGSIEAELPQGTLRFASINELRSHLEKSA